MLKHYKITETRKPQSGGTIGKITMSTWNKSSKEALNSVFMPLLKGQKLTLTIEEVPQDFSLQKTNS